MKKIFFIFSFFLLFAVIKSVMAQGAFAAVEGYLDNRSGSVPVTVTVTVKDNNGATLDTFTPPAVSAGSRYFYTRASVAPASAPSISWFNACNFGGANTTGGPTVYTFDDQNVRCQTTNSTLTVTKTFCTNNNGRAEWKVNTNPAPNQTPNISPAKSFKVYKSLNGDPNTDTSPLTATYVAGTYTNYFIDLPGLSDGPWNVMVRAYTNDPDDKTSVAYGSFACGVDVVTPGNLNAVPGCSGSSVRVEFSWTGTNLTYRVQLGSSSSGPWSDLNATDVTQTFYSHTGSPLAASTTYWWRIKSENIPPSGFEYFSTPSSFTTVSCPVTVTPPNLDNMPALTCASSSDNLNTNPDDDNMNNASPNYVRLQWNRALPLASIQAEQVQYSTDPAFPTNLTTTVTSGFGPTPNLATDTQRVALINGTFGAYGAYYWKVQTRIDGQWYQSKSRFFVGPGTCFSPPVVPIAYSYCYNNQPYFNVRWMGSTLQTRTLRSHVWNIFAYGSPVNIATTNKFMWDGAAPPVVLANGGTGFSVTGPDGSYGPAGINQVIFRENCLGVSGNPSNLSVTNNACVASKPVITFSFNVVNDSDEHWLEISSEPFTGDMTTNPSSKWGVKKFSNTQGLVNFIWQDTNLLLSGDANPDADDTNNLKPLNGVTYYWRVKTIALGYFGGNLYYGNSSPYYYPDGTATSSTFPTGLPVKAKNCNSGYDLAVSIVPGSWKNGISVTNINVDNVGSGYTLGDPTVSFSGGGGTGAAAQAVRTGDTVTSINITSGGTGYTSAPTVAFSGGGGTGAAATAQIGGGVQTQSFVAGEIASVDVKITNNLGTQTTPSPATIMYFYYKGTAQGVSPSVEAPPVCPGDGRASPPTLGSVIPQPVSVAAIDPGGSRTYTVSFTADGAQASSTAIAYVVPNCDFGGGLGPDDNFSNNSASFSYSVAVNKFFQANSGDVGAKNQISVGINSSALGTPIYQSKHLLAAANLVKANVPTTAPAGFRLNNYDKNLVQTGGTYNYFARRFRQKAIDSGNSACSITTGAYTSNFYYCSGSVTTALSSPVTITGTPVFFIDGDLTINSNILLAAGANGAVFIVKGDIYAKAVYDVPAVTVLNGIFITRRSFYDCIGSACEANGNPSFARLIVNGSVIADAEDGTPGILLARYFATLNFNNTAASNTFNFDPRYLSLYSNILATTPVGWDEVAP